MERDRVDERVNKREREIETRSVKEELKNRKLAFSREESIRKANLLTSGIRNHAKKIGKK